MTDRIWLLALSTVVAVCIGSYSSEAMHASDTPVIEYGTGKTFVVSVGGHLGLLNGGAVETVYESDVFPRFKASELTWDLENVVFAGLTVSMVSRKSWGIRGGVWLPLTEKSGQMDDYDWFLGTPGSPWTDWSLSDIDLVSAHMFDINVYVNVLSRTNFTVAGVLGYKKDYWHWLDYGVSHVYSSDPWSAGGFRDDVATEDGTTGIEYEQDFSIPYAGVEARYSRARLRLAGYLLYSPRVEASDLDYHIFRGILFEGKFSGGDYLGAGVRADYVFRRNWSMSASLDYQHIGEIIGDAYNSRLGLLGTWVFEDGAGIEHTSRMVSLSLGRTF